MLLIVVKVLMLLEYFFEDELEMGLLELVCRFGVDKVVVYWMLGVMVEIGLVE